MKARVAGVKAVEGSGGGLKVGTAPNTQPVGFASSIDLYLVCLTAMGRFC